MKCLLGLMHVRFDCTWSNAFLKDQLYAFMAYAITTLADRLTPILQCTRTLEPSCLTFKRKKQIIVYDERRRNTFNGAFVSYSAFVMYLYVLSQCFSRSVLSSSYTRTLRYLNEPGKKLSISLVTFSMCRTLKTPKRFVQDSPHTRPFHTHQAYYYAQTFTYPFRLSSSRLDAFHSEPRYTCGNICVAASIWPNTVSISWSMNGLYSPRSMSSVSSNRPRINLEVTSSRSTLIMISFRALRITRSVSSRSLGLWKKKKEKHDGGPYRIIKSVRIVRFRFAMGRT